MNESIMLGDCLELLPKIPTESVDLIYLDPPFFSQKKQKLQTRDGSRNYAFEDCWLNLDAYREYIKLRLEQCRRVLKETGSLFLHCDRSASHHLRFALDQVFGNENFQSEIIWSYRRWSNAKKGLLNAHQVIFFYSKGPNFKFNQIYDSYSPTTNLDQILQERVRDERGKSVYKTDTDGNSVIINDKKGVPLSDVWEIPYLNPKAKERVSYPTQKPIILIEKIIQLVTDVGDLVLDPFAGSGTTLVASKLLGRKFLGMDQSNAVDLTTSRLNNPIRSESALLKRGIGAYQNQDLETEEILGTLGAMVVQRNKGIDGFIRTENGLVPVKIKKPNETLDEAIGKLARASAKNAYTRQVLFLSKKSDEVKDYAKDGLLILSDPTEVKAALSSK